MMPRYVAIALLTCVFTTSERVSAQRIRMALSVSDSSVGGIFSSGFAAALRALGDVDVVTTSELADYAIRVVAMCERTPRGDCVAYSLAISLSEPFTRHDATLAVVVARTGWDAQPGVRSQADSASNHIYRFFRWHAEHHQMWVVGWGRQRYEQGVREHVAEIDALCLDKTRRIRRLVRDNPSYTDSDYQAVLAGRDWIC